MVFDNIKNAYLYYGISEKIATALKFLDSDLFNIKIGVYEIEGKNITASVFKTDLIPMEKGVWEAHRKHIDIHCMIEGTEKMGCVNLGLLNEKEEYNDDEDYQLGKGEGDFVTLNAGMFVILFPEDAHMPCVAINQPEEVRRVILKIKL